MMHASANQKAVSLNLHRYIPGEAAAAAAVAAAAAAAADEKSEPAGCGRALVTIVHFISLH
jgi:hypothetical protein